MTKFTCLAMLRGFVQVSLDARLTLACFLSVFRWFVAENLSFVGFQLTLCRPSQQKVDLNDRRYSSLSGLSLITPTSDFFFFFDVSVMVNILRERTSPMPDLLLHVHNGPNSLCYAAGRRDKVWVIFLHFLSRTDSICFELKTLIRTTFPSTQSPFSFLLPGVLSVTGGFDAFTFFTAMSLYLHPLCGSAGSITFSQQAHCLPMC